MVSAPQSEVRRQRLVRPVHVIGVAIIVLAIVTGYFGLQGALRPYTTSITEATTSGRSVQLAGFLGSTGAYDVDGNFTFDLQDQSGALVKVISTKPKPANFEQAVSIVAIGRYDAARKAFLADDMLVKCPSKYQEQLTQSAGA